MQELVRVQMLHYKSVISQGVSLYYLGVSTTYFSAVTTNSLRLLHVKMLKQVCPLDAQNVLLNTTVSPN